MMHIPTFPDRPVDELSVAPAEALNAIGRGSRQRHDLLALSDLSRDDAREVARLWPTLPESDRIVAMRTLSETAEAHVTYLYERVFRIALRDSSAVVRQIAISSLWEDESDDLMEALIDLLQRDDSTDVRAESAAALARFADQAASDELDEDIASRLHRALLDAAEAVREEPFVRRRALESLAIFGGQRVRELIADSYESDDSAIRASAVYAMGRSLDHSWLPTVLTELESDDAELRYEAARASGELGKTDALPALAELLQDADTEVRQAAISALGRIGGAGSLRILRGYQENVPDLDREIVEDALTEAELSSGHLRSAS